MSLNWLLWFFAVVIAVLVGLSKYAHIDVPQVSSVLMQDSTTSLFVALALALLARVL